MGTAYKKGSCSSVSSFFISCSHSYYSCLFLLIQNQTGDLHQQRHVFRPVSANFYIISF
ncbi:Uncharacterized protein dnm_010740 [Desulfonema magnum]|uniref:Uncharacterized protein n=1 Tax=Desulfonema magnum TaxID=45655 RepID=A0A975BGW8_9BACT|nr:Uncharacterized protein dnm_010740 [Desulfonema magnum]